MKAAGIKKPTGRLPPRRGLVKMRILHLIIEFCKEIMSGSPKNNKNVLSKEVNPEHISGVS